MTQRYLRASPASSVLSVIVMVVRRVALASATCPEQQPNHENHERNGNA